MSEVDEILDHPTCRVDHLAGQQATYDPEGIPVVDLAEPASRNDDRVWQVEKGEAILVACHLTVNLPSKQPPAVVQLATEVTIVVSFHGKGCLWIPIQRLPWLQAAVFGKVLCDKVLNFFFLRAACAPEG